MLFIALLLWVFEIQLLMQIIINRVAVIADDPRVIKKIKVRIKAIPVIVITFC